MGCTAQSFPPSPCSQNRRSSPTPPPPRCRLLLHLIAAACTPFAASFYPILSVYTSFQRIFCSLLNAHANEDDIADAVTALDPSLFATPAYPSPDLSCMLANLSSSMGAQFPPPPIDRAGRRIYYPLDYASVLSAAALCVVPGSSVLDVCAAPGGKSIAISQSLRSGGFLVCNEPDGDRRRRLTASLKEHCRLLH